MERLLATLFALCLLISATACQEKPDTAAAGAPHLSGPGEVRPTIAPPPPGSGVGAAGLTWSVPAGWMTEVPSSRMRKAQYRIAGETGDAECVVFYFGPGQGGDPMANAQRWANQFTLADGRPGTEGMKISSRKVGEIDVLSVEVAGAHQGGFRMESREAAPIPGQMLLGAVAQGPDANWFFKLTGPEATVVAQRAAFEQLIGSIKPGS